MHQEDAPGPDAVTVHFTTSVVLSEDGRGLILSGPKTGVLTVRFADPGDTVEIFELLQGARERCWKAFVDERQQSCPALGRFGPATRELLSEIVTLTELAMEIAETTD